MQYDKFNEHRTPRSEVYAAIDSERDYQMAMAAKAHGDPSNDGKKHLEEFVLYMEDYLDECRKQLSRTWGPDAYDAPLNTLRKVVAIGVGAMEVWGAPHRLTPTKHESGTDLSGVEDIKAILKDVKTDVATREYFTKVVKEREEKKSGAPLVEAPVVPLTPEAMKGYEGY